MKAKKPSRPAIAWRARTRDGDVAPTPRKFDIPSWVVAIFTVVLAIVGVWQLSAMERQLSQIQEDRRPWVSIIGGELTAPVTFNETAFGGQAWVRVPVEVSGQTPALKVRAIGHMYPKFEGYERQLNRCKEARNYVPKKGETFAEQTLFPGRHQLLVWALWPMDELKALRAQGHNKMSFGVFVCVIYEDTRRVRMSTFNYEMFRKDPADPGLDMTQATIPVDTLIFRRDSSGTTGPAD